MLCQSYKVWWRGWTATPVDPLVEEKGAGGVEVVEGLAMALLYLPPLTLATCSISLTTSSMAASLVTGLAR